MKKAAAIVAFAVLCLLPAVASAQATITGTVRDTSGAVLPGVTVEAASPALIEKVRSVVTDGTGQYRIVDLRPGAYTVSFSLVGFSTVRRDGVELTGSFVATINAELRVGALEETITVTGESPIVDVQSARQQRVLDKDTIDAIPTARRVFDLAVLIPGVGTNAQDVGGAVVATNFAMTAHGSRGQEQRVMIGGVSVANVDGQGGFAQIHPNMSSVQEVVIDTGGASAESSQGGVNINVIPKDGGNVFAGTFFGTYANESLQADNYSDRLKGLGLSTPNRIEKIYDVNPGYGGPIRRDSLWFYSAARWQASVNSVAGMFYNANVGKTTLPDAWLYAADRSRPAFNRQYVQSYNTRVTWQANQKNKFSLFLDNQSQCRSCGQGATATVAPEGFPTGSAWPFNSFATLSWTNPITNRVLFEGSFMNHGEKWRSHNTLSGLLNRSLIPVTDQASGITYHAPNNSNFGANYTSWRNQNWIGRFAMSYVTGAHNVKLGIQNMSGYLNWYTDDNDARLSYRFNDGVPNQITQRATPFTVNSNIKADLGIFVQDQWTIRRLTVNAGIRYDYFNIYFPEQHIGPTLYLPTRDITFPEEHFLGWHDLTPRFAASYDLFGNGKTAVKASANKYVAGNGLSSSGIFGALANPTIRMAYSVTRTWNDANRNYAPDCDLRNIEANGECGVVSDRNFGNPIRASLSYDPETLNGWGKRGFNWEFSGAVQHQLLPRLSVYAGFFRRVYGNFVVTDNRAVTAADYSTFSVTAPVDPRLPGGGGYLVSDLRDLNPNRVGQVDNYLTFSKNAGGELEHWNGFDVSVNARLGWGLNVQGGTSTGRTTIDRCALLAQLPEAGPLTVPYCHQELGFLTQVKGLATYTIPRIGVLTSATFQSIPGAQILANYVATNAIVAPSLGRNLTGATNVTVNLVRPGEMFGERLNQLDMRIGKIFRAAGRSATVSLDIYNALNNDAVLQENSSYAQWRRPQGILTARFAKFSLQFDF